MDVYIKDLYHNTRKQYNLNWIAGQSGENHVVNWLYLAEDIENASFLKEDELILSTGFASNGSKEWLLPFIQELIQQKTCGLILNTGKYLSEDDISPEVIQFCNEHEYPLLTIPWETSITDLTQNYCNRIFDARQQEFNLSTALKNIILGDTPSDTFMDALAELSYKVDDPYCLTVIQLESASSDHNITTEEFRQYVRRSQPLRSSDYICFPFQNVYLIMWHKTQPEDIRYHTREFLRSCQSQSSIQNIYIGISEFHGSLSDLSRLYQHALGAVKMARSTDSHIAEYESMGSFQLFHAISDIQLMEDFYRKQLGILEDYDKLHNSMYLETLENYLKYNGHLADIADAMICHKNTINYRLGRIRELLDTDLNDGHEKYLLYLAIHIRKYLQLN